MIKASQILFSLNERFIANPDKVGEVVDFLKSCVEDQKVQKWLSSIFRLYLINDFDRVTRILSLKDLPSNSPKWVIDAFNKGEEVYVVTLTGAAREDVEHEATLIINYFQSPDAPKRFDSMKFPDALARAKTWRKNVLRGQLDTKDLEFVEFVAKYNDMQWVKLVAPEAYDREGDRMHNCMDRRYYARGAEIYSLRDERNKPHCSIEAEYRELNQVKGYNNGPIEEKYRDACLDFINKHLKPDSVTKLGVSDLAKNLGAVWVFASKKVVRAPA
jgi:hypothetical protein